MSEFDFKTEMHLIKLLGLKQGILKNYMKTFVSFL